MARIIGTALLLVALAGQALAAAVVDAPEIDASTGVAAVTLIGGALIVLRARKRR